jgi:hypothetical protein
VTNKWILREMEGEFWLRRGKLFLDGYISKSGKVRDKGWRKGAV